MKTIEEEIAEWAWMPLDKIENLMKGTAVIWRHDISKESILQLLKDGWTALPF